MEKAHLLHDLRPNPTVDTGKAEQQDRSISLEDVTPEAIRLRLAHLEAQLAAAEALDWISLYDAAREDRILTNLPNYSNLHHNERVQLEQAHQERYYARTEEIKRDRREHNALMEQLRRSVNALRSYVTRQRSASEAANTQVSEAASSQHTQALEGFRRRKQELLKKKDELAIKLARLRGGKQSKTGATLYAETRRISDEATSPAGASPQDARGSPSTATPFPHNDGAPLLPNAQAPSEFDVHSLRLHMPNDQLKIDNSLTIDIRPQVSARQLREQLVAMQARLRTFHPPLDELPLNITPHGKGPSRDKAYMLKTWLKILVSRYQAKTGIFGQPVEDAREAEKRGVVGELSPEAKVRMARRWNELFGVKRGLILPEQASLAQTGKRFYSMDAGALNDGLREKERQETALRNEPQTQPPSHDTARTPPSPSPQQPQPFLPHLTPTGSAHMVSISTKPSTPRVAIAVGTVYFSNPTPLSLITSNSLKKGDVLSVSRIAGIMAAKKCPEIVPLCHPIALTHVGVELRTFGAEAPASSSASSDLHASRGTDVAGTDARIHTAGPDDLGHGGVQIECTVACAGSTGVEMEALTAVMGTALSVVDMCKAVDRFQRIGDVRVVRKEGGKSGVWREEGWVSWQ